jgi:hypothetical protein
MLRSMATAALFLAVALPVSAQNWSVGVHTGPFVFGDFVERKLRPANGQGAEDPVTVTLSAATRPGLSVDLERSFGERWAVRFEGTFTHAPFAVDVQGGDAEGLDVDAGSLDVSTFVLPVVFRINPRGSLRFHLLAGPAHALYRAEGRENSTGAEPAFEGVKSEWGVALGGGASWWLSERFAIEGNLTDVVTSSPFDRSDFPDAPGIDVPRPHNVHTTIGARWKF